MNKRIFFLASLLMVIGINTTTKAYTKASFKSKKTEAVIAVKDSYAAPKVSVLVRIPHIEESEDFIITPILNSSLIGDCLGKTYQDMEVSKALDMYINDFGSKFLTRMERVRSKSPKAFDGQTFDYTSTTKVNQVLYKVLSTQQTIEEFNEESQDPITITRYFNYNLNTGLPLRLKDIFVSAYDLQILEIMHRQFVEVYRYTPGATSIETPRFVTENIEISKEGIKFVYEPKSISNNYDKQYEIFLSYEELSTVIQNDFYKLIEPQKEKPLKVNRAYDANRRF